MPKVSVVPTYNRRICRGKEIAYVTLRDPLSGRRKCYWLGPYDSPESRERYSRLLLEWEAHKKRLPTPPTFKAPGLSMDELILEYFTAVSEKQAYGPSEVDTIRQALRVACRLYGSTNAASFGPNALRVVRDAMITGDPTGDPPRKPWSRKNINAQITRIVAMFRWATAHELLPVEIYQALRTIEPLRRGKTTARESAPVGPAPQWLIDATLKNVSAQVGAMAELQLLAGMRPGEVVGLRLCDLKMSGPVWTYSPEDHKTAHHGKRRVIYLGPKAQEVIRRFRDGRNVAAPLFSPSEAESARLQARHEHRRTREGTGYQPGENRSATPQRPPGEAYTVQSYAKAIARGCEAAFPPPTELRRQKIKTSRKHRRESRKEWAARLGPEKWAELKKWQRDHHWHPHQLRHNFATAVEKQFGLEAAAVLLGHSSAKITEAVYVDRDRTRAMKVSRKIG